MMLLERLRVLGAEKKVQQEVSFFFFFPLVAFRRDPNKIGKHVLDYKIYELVEEELWTINKRSQW